MKFRPFHRLWVYIRAMAIQDAREKRIIRENIESWNRVNRARVKADDRQFDKEMDWLFDKIWDSHGVSYGKSGPKQGWDWTDLKPWKGYYHLGDFDDTDPRLKNNIWK